MTEQEPDHELLAELLDKTEPTSDEPILTRRDEQKLLDEANRVEPPTLAPAEIGWESPHPAGTQRRLSATSFGAEAIDLVRRHPIPALILAASVAYLLFHRKR